MLNSYQLKQTPISGDKVGETDAEGVYEIKPIPNGTYAIEVSADVYETKLIESYKIKLGTVSTLDITLVALMES